MNEANINEYLKSITDHEVSSEGACVLIGDLHGSLDRLKDLLVQLEREVTRKLGAESWAHATLVFLGDYVDKGHQSRPLLDFLVGDLGGTLAPSQRTVFLMGNHDFSLMAFLDLIPHTQLTLPHPLTPKLGDAFGTKYYESKGEALWRGDTTNTNTNNTIISSNNNNENNNKKCNNNNNNNNNAIVVVSSSSSSSSSEGGDVSTMHIQGRRYGVPGSYFTVESTFESYGCSGINRRELCAKMPEAHKDFFRSLQMVRVLGVPGRGHVLCVHAGLVEDRPAREQVEFLRAGNCGVSWIEQLSGSAGVRMPPVELRVPGVLVASGHHAFLSVADYPNRVIVDTSESGCLSALVLPPKSALDVRTKKEIEGIMDIDFSDDQVFAQDDLRYGSFVVQSAKYPF